jgi:hypothetical protein
MTTKYKVITLDGDTYTRVSDVVEDLLMTAAWMHKQAPNNPMVSAAVLTLESQAINLQKTFLKFKDKSDDVMPVPGKRIVK